MRGNQEKFWVNIDKWLLILYVLLVLIGWISIYAAVYDETHSSIFDFSQRYGKQMIWILVSLLLGILILSVEVTAFSSPSYVYYIITILVLLATLLLAPEIKGARSWIPLGSFAIQPSEFAKIFTCLVLAKFLGDPYNYLSRWNKVLISAFLIILPALITLLQHDTGSALVFFSLVLVLHREGLIENFLMVGIYLVALSVVALYYHDHYVMIGSWKIGVNFWIGVFLLFIFTWYVYTMRLRIRRKRSILRNTLLLALISIGILVSINFFFNILLEPHQKERIEILLGKKNDPKGAGYNLHQSLIAIGSGGFWGKGFLQGTQTKFNFVPEQSTDFIFCTIGEEWGFVGSTVFILLFVSLLLRMVYVAERQRSAFSRIYGYGVLSILFFHFFVNIGMTIGLVPVIGIPLPFISYGGSSMMAFSMLFFIFLKLDKERYYMIR